MSATEWKFVPVESDENMATAFFDRVTVTSRGGLIGIRSALNAAIAAAPVPPSVESLLENWTPSDQQAFAKFRDEHFPGEMDSYAIQSLGSAWKDGQANSQPKPAAHLTIPGALEWDGDNGTHGADGESSSHGDTDEKAIQNNGEPFMYGIIGPDGKPHFSELCVSGNAGDLEGEVDSLSEDEGGYREVALYLAPVSAYTAVDMTTAAADGFRGGLAAFSADGNRNVLAEVFFQKGDDPFICAVRGRICVEQLEAAQRDFRESLPDELEQGDGIYTFDFFYEKGQYDEFGRCEIAPGWGFDFVSYAAFEAADEPADPAKCESCGDWGHIETEDSAHDCPECGPSVVERAVEAGVMNAPKPYAAMSEAEAEEFLSSFGGGSGNKAKRRIAAMEAAKQKTCIECDQPYCHGVCVERGDQDYDRDQAAKGGCDE